MQASCINPRRLHWKSPAQIRQPNIVMASTKFRDIDRLSISRRKGERRP
jgi:hypothetical protein